MIGKVVRGGVAAAVVGAGVIGFGQVASNEDETVRNESGEIVESGGLGAFRMQVGDCLRYPDGAGGSEPYEVASVEGVPCAEPHDGEVYALFDLPHGSSAPFPGQGPVFDEAAIGCLDRFTAFIGISYANSPTWDIEALYPTLEGWTQIDDREVVCIVVPLDGVPTTGSAEGSRI
ncbi:MAG: septum formation family protein [Actinomycetota bacterium]